MFGYNLCPLWQKFVLNEGIMPAPLVRLIKGNEQNMQDTNLLASVLKMRENYANPEHPDIEDLSKTAFLNDEPLYTWLASVDNILNILIDFSKVKQNADDILNGACTSFIKSCPLVNQQIKDSYLNAPGTMIPPEDKGIKLVNKEDFITGLKKTFYEKYLKNKYSTATVNSYKSAINLGCKIFKKNLWVINNPTTIQNLITKASSKDPAPTTEEEELRKLFRQKNSDTHNALYNAMKNYQKFLELKEENKKY